MAEILQKDVLGEFRKEHNLLVGDLHNFKLTFAEAQQRCYNLWKIVPFNIDVNTVELNEIMKRQFKNHPEWKNTRTYKININK